jgi:Holliday junction resolvase
MTSKDKEIKIASDALVTLVDFLESDEGHPVIQAFRIGACTFFDADVLNAAQMRLVLKLRILQVWLDK